MDKDYVERTFQPLWEARQDAAKPVCEGDYDPAKRYRARLEALYGETTGEIDLEQDIF